MVRYGGSYCLAAGGEVIGLACTACACKASFAVGRYYGPLRSGLTAP